MELNPVLLTSVTLCFVGHVPRARATLPNLHAEPSAHGAEVRRELRGRAHRTSRHVRTPILIHIKWFSQVQNIFY